MAFGKTGFGDKKSSSGFGKKSSSSFGKDSENSGFGKKSSSGFGSKKSSSSFGEKSSSSFGSKKSSGFGSEKTSTGFEKKKGFGSKSSSGFGNKKEKPEFSAFAPFGSVNKSKEIRAKLGDIDMDMKAIMIKLIGDHRDRKSSESIQDNFNGVDTSKVKLDILYDETVAMCPAFSIISKNGGFSTGEGFKSTGLFVNGKKGHDLSEYSISTIGSKFQAVIKCFLDIEKILDGQDKPFKLDANNSTISVIDGTIVLTPSSLLLNSLKNDIFKVSH